MSTGKGTKSVRKSQQGNEIIPSVGFLNTVAKHKATLGQTVISLGSLTTPPEATALGFVQPSGGTLSSMDLQRYKNNVRVQSTVRGLMDQPLDYRITGSSQITLNVAAFEDEIFTISVDSRPQTAINLVAAQPKVQSYTLPVGQTDIPAGVYTVNKNPGEDVGEFMVVVDRQLMYRNTGNGTSGGDYQELSGIIRLNDADLVNQRKVTMIWVGALLDNPQDSQLALIQTLQGQIDAMIPTLAAVAGVSESTFQSAPNDPDLLAFGTQVLNHESRLAALEAIPAGGYVDSASGAIAATSWQVINYTNVVRMQGISYLNGVWTIITPGWYIINAGAGIIGTGIAGLVEGIRISINGTAVASNAPRQESTNLNAAYNAGICAYLVPGNTISCQRYTDRTGAAYDNAIVVASMSVVKR